MKKFFAGILFGTALVYLFLIANIAGVSATINHRPIDIMLDHQSIQYHLAQTPGCQLSYDNVIPSDIQNSYLDINPHTGELSQVIYWNQSEYVTGQVTISIVTHEVYILHFVPTGLYTIEYYFHCYEESAKG
jgi:hypothetical protein